jgi:hypothetical protein
MPLNDNLLDDSIPSEIGLLNLLTSLDLSTNLLSGKILHESGLLPPLVDLDLSSRVHSLAPFQTHLET